MLRSVVPVVVIATLIVVTVMFAAPVPKKIPLPKPTEQQLEQSRKNLKLLGLGLHNYHDENQFFPLNHTNKDQALLSWRVMILPYIEQEKLFKQFRLNEPWDSEHNKKLIPKIPLCYQPIRVTVKEGLTFYQDVPSSGTGFSVRRASFRNISDGTSNTIAVVEALKPVIWTKPEDVALTKDRPLNLGGMFDGDFHFLRFDGSVDLWRKNTKKELAPFLTRAGGEVVDWE